MHLPVYYRLFLLLAWVCCFTLHAQRNHAQDPHNAELTKRIFTLEYGRGTLYTGKYQPGKGTIIFRSPESDYPVEYVYYGDTETDKQKLYQQLKTTGEISNSYVDFEINLCDTALWTGKLTRTIKQLKISDCFINSLVTTWASESKEPVVDTLYISERVSITDTRFNFLELSYLHFKGAVWFTNCKVKSNWYVSDFVCDSVLGFVNSNFGISGANIYSFNGGRLQKGIFAFSHCTNFEVSEITAEDSLVIDLDYIDWDSAVKFHKGNYQAINIKSFKYMKLVGLISEITLSGLTLMGELELQEDHKRVFDSSLPPEKTKKWYFDKINIIGNLITTVNSDYSVVKAGFLPYQIKQMPIRYDDLDNRKHNDNKGFLFALNNEIIATENNKNWSQTDRDEVVQWFNFLKDENRFQYLDQHPALNPGEWFEWLWLSITRKVVNHGYQGLGAFSFWALSIVMLFACIFFFFKRYTITHYVNSGEIVAMDVKNATITLGGGLAEVFKRFLIYFGDFFRCTWFSFVVLVNPRWPSKYFKFTPGLLFVVFAEWFIGLFLLFMFVVYILSRYSFVKAFLAL
jgi:hypothetical protein